MGADGEPLAHQRGGRSAAAVTATDPWSVAAPVAGAQGYPLAVIPTQMKVLALLFPGVTFSPLAISAGVAT